MIPEGANVTGMYLVLAIFLIFIALILSQKVKIHVAALCIPIFLEITGVLTFKEAWSGVATSTVIMMCGMFVVGAAIGKTSILGKISGAVIKPGASDRQIMFGFFLTVAALTQITNAAATITIMIPLVTAVCAEHKRPMSKFMWPVAILAQSWTGVLPIGQATASYLSHNQIIENLGATGTFRLMDTLIAKWPTTALVTILVLWVYPKLCPDNGNIPTLADADAAPSDKAKRLTTGKLSPVKEKIAIWTFAGTMVGIIACSLIPGAQVWWPAIVGALVIVFTGVLDDKEAVVAIGNPVIFLTIGTLPLATALNKTGAQEFLANLFRKATANMSGFWIMVFLFIVCCVLTQFMTNSAVANAFRPVAAIMALALGNDPRALMLAVERGSQNAYCTPMCTPGFAMAYEAGGYTMKQFFKLGILTTVCDLIVFCAVIPQIFPFNPM